MDYDKLIDAETWAFIRRTENFYPVDAETRDIAFQRQVYDAMCNAFNAGRPDGVRTEDAQADTVPVRIYSTGSPTRTVVYFHGGGWVLGGLHSHDCVCAEICAQTGFRVVAVDYRLAPEYPHPAAFDDSWAAAQWAAREWGEGLVLVGDSAGGNLAAAVAHHARGRLGPILGQVLIYPGLGGDPDRGSYSNHADAPMLTRSAILAYRDLRADGAAPAADPTFEPLADTDFTGLPPTVIFSAECDPLSDDGRDYRDKIVAAGDKACWVNERGLVHGYLRARTTVERARASFIRIVEAIDALGKGNWHW